MVIVLAWFGIVALISSRIPVVAISPILLYIGMLIGAQAFQESPKSHAPAVVLALTLVSLPSNVRESVERLRKELAPEGGLPDWKRVRERRKRAANRISAMERYATASRCRRGELLRYFGEHLRDCAGCDRHPVR